MPGGYSGKFSGTKGARREPLTHADRMLADLKNVDCLCELLWAGYDERVPDFDTKQELLEWLRQPAEEGVQGG